MTKHGSRKLKSIDFAQPITATTLQKGRSKELLRARNVAIIHRYYYYNVVKQVKFEDTITALVADFWLAPYTISKVLEANMTEVKELRKTKPTVAALRKLFTSFNW